MSEIVYRPYQSADAMPLLAMWRESYETALHPYRNPHSSESQLVYLTGTLAEACDITVAVDPAESADSSIIGFLALSREKPVATVEQLYIAVAAQGRGVGQALLRLAKRRSPEGLRLHTFQRNLKARRFYMRAGFTERSYGYRNMEGLADILMTWSPGNREPGFSARARL